MLKILRLVQRYASEPNDSSYVVSEMVPAYRAAAGQSGSYITFCPLSMQTPNYLYLHYNGHITICTDISIVSRYRKGSAPTIYRTRADHERHAFPSYFGQNTGEYR